MPAYGTLDLSVQVPYFVILYCQIPVKTPATVHVSVFQTRTLLLKGQMYGGKGRQRRSNGGGGL